MPTPPLGTRSSGKNIFLIRLGMMLGLGLLMSAMFYQVEALAMTRSTVHLGLLLFLLYFLFLGLNALEDYVVRRATWWFVVLFKLTRRAIKAVIWMGLGAYFYVVWDVNEEQAYWQLGIFSVLVVIPKVVDAFLEEDPAQSPRLRGSKFPKI